MELKRRNLISNFKAMLQLFACFWQAVCWQEVFSVCRPLDMIREVGLEQRPLQALFTELQSDNAASIVLDWRT